MGSGQSPLQPVDAPLRRAIRWVMPPTHTIAPAQRPQPPHTMPLRWRQYTQKLPKLPNTSQYFPQTPPSILSPAYAVQGGIRYTVAGRTPVCRAIELGCIGRVWEELGSGQSPLQPVDAPLRRAIRWVMPPTHTIAPAQRPQPPHTMPLRWRQYTQKLPKLPNTSQYFPQTPPSILLPAYAVQGEATEDKLAAHTQYCPHIAVYFVSTKITRSINMPLGLVEPSTYAGPVTFMEAQISLGKFWSMPIMPLRI